MYTHAPYKCPWADEEIDAFREMTGRFLDKEMVPDDEEARKQGDVGKALWRRAGELGFLCTDVPVEFGGAGGDFRHEAVFIEEMSRRGLSGMNSGIHSIVAHYILNHGTQAQKEKYLPKMVAGELIGAIAMTEPNSGSDLQATKTKAEKQEDGSYVVNGSKTFITNGYLAEIVLVVAKTDPSAGAKGISIFVVETDNQPGYRVGRKLDKIGLKAQDTAELFFDDMPLGAEQLLGGEEGKGFYQLMGDLPYERLMVAVTAVGVMEGAWQETLEYVKERKAFGQAIFDFQNTRFELADMATQIMSSRVFLDSAIRQYLEGQLDPVGASMIKLQTTDMQGVIVDRCLQLFGGYGYMNEYKIARMFVDSRVQRIYGGTNEIMKEIISRSI